MKKKKKQKSLGFFATVRDLLLIGFLFYCFCVAAWHRDDLTQQQQVSSIVPVDTDQPLDIKEVIQVHDANLRNANMKSKPFSQKEMTCLAKNIFFEARGTDDEERIRVINVTTNRTKSTQFGGTYCEVVYDHAQFSWTLNLYAHNITKIIARHFSEKQAWQHAVEMAKYELGYGYPDTTDGALYYHTYDVDPKWAHDGSNQQVVASNYHKFYKPY